MTELEALADTLDSSQAHAMMVAAECKGGEFWTPYPVGDARFARSGTLTPTGLALRAHLLAQDTTPAASLRAIAGTSQEQEG